MLKDFLLGKTAIPLLSKGLNVYALRQKAIADNLANVNTPGYQRKQISFEEQLESAVQKTLGGFRTQENHFRLGSENMQEFVPELVVDHSPELKNGINNVDVDQEIVEQVKNEIRFLYAARMLNRNFAALRASIKGRFDQ